MERTGALPLRTAGVRVDEDGQAQQTALRLRGVVAAVQRRVVEKELSVETDQLGALINAVRIRSLRRQHLVLYKSENKQQIAVLFNL